MIAKWPLPMWTKDPVKPPEGKILGVANQHDQLVCWTDTARPGPSRLLVLQTGETCPPGYEYIDTVLFGGGTYVIHVFVEHDF